MTNTLLSQQGVLANSAGGGSGLSGTTLDPAHKGSLVTLSNGNLTATCLSSSYGVVRSTTSLNRGKWYFEAKFVALGGGDGAHETLAVGVCDSNALMSDTLGQVGFPADSKDSVGAYNDGALQMNGLAGPPIWASAAVNTGDVIGVAIDISGKQIWVKNITQGLGWNTGNSGTPNPATGVGGFSIASMLSFNPVYAAVGFFFQSSGSPSVTMNFGDSAFTGSVPTGWYAWDSPAGGSADETGGTTPLTIDISAVAVGGSSASSSVAAPSFTTALTNDILVASFVVEAAAATNVLSISDTAGLTWHKLAAYSVAGFGSLNCSVEIWWAYSAAALSSAETVTATLSGTADAANIIVTAVNGCMSFNNPWDDNPLAITNQIVTTTSSGPVQPYAYPSLTLSSDSANTMFIAVFGEAYYSDFNRGPDNDGFTYNKNLTNGSSSRAVQLQGTKAFSSTLNNATCAPVYSGVGMDSGYFVGIAAALNSMSGQ